jgi:hypothetical protein
MRRGVIALAELVMRAFCSRRKGSGMKPNSAK